MAFEDIERLKEKVDKDPNSKLFIPLAEEYKKAGMFDEAIEVLTRGLERQPDYMSARVSLGKVYVERGMLEEARAEFEQVINAIPDNLYAHKRLAEIYRDLGEKDKAVKEFKTVLKLNPMDDWAATNLTDIEMVPKPISEEVEARKPEEIPDEIAEIPDEDILEEKEEVPSQEGDELIEELEGRLPEIDEEVFEEIEEVSSEAVKEEMEPIEEIAPEVSEETLEEITSVEAKEERAIEREEEGIQITEKKAPEEDLFEELYKTSEVVFDEREIVRQKEEISEEPLVSISDADIYISQEKFIDAMNVYREILSKDPDNRHVNQRIEELKALLKLLGKDKEALIERLNRMLESIKKRRDEFRRST